MQTIVTLPSIAKSRRNDQFCGLCGDFTAGNLEIVECSGICSNRPFHLLCLIGTVRIEFEGKFLELRIKITETREHGPLYINKGKESFFIYNDGAVRKLMDVLKINLTSDLVGKNFRVYNNAKGFWVISIDNLTC